MSDVIIREDELQVLINGFDDIRVSYPLYEGDILVARPEGMGFHLELPASRETFQGWLSGYEPIASELPSYSDLQECMLASGIVGYANQATFGEVLTSYEHLTKTVYFGLDTNLFYHCFVTNNPGISHASYLIVDTVRDEITYAINRKYRAKRIEEMVVCAPDHRDYIVELENKRTKRSRKAAYLALKEYRAIRDRAAAIPSPAPHSHLSEENDRNIVRALRRFEEERYALPVLLTSDIYMADLCTAEGLEYFYLDRPYNAEVTSCMPPAFRRLLFNLAVVFGFIQCNGIAIFGEYGGKGNNLDELKVRFQDGGQYHDFSRDLRICRQLSTLDISR
ncbi:MAG: hypothetical protein GX885_08180 [Methanomicrobiales archaeon]|nr:hypothetical protein [Methanomicrobiales archaeon]